MHTLFKEKHPNVKCSYDSYRDIFNTKFNISFGYPRKDTCTTCDKMKVKIEAVDTELNNAPPNSEISANLYRRKDELTTNLELHQRKGEVFYERRRASRIQAQGSEDVEAVCFDFQKNLPLPNVTTQDVYFSRQLSFFTAMKKQLVKKVQMMCAQCSTISLQTTFLRLWRILNCSVIRVRGKIKTGLSFA